MKASDILARLESVSERPIENPSLLLSYIEVSLRNSTRITFFNWECPPRFMDTAPDGSAFVNYDVDLEKIFRKEKIDEFTEFPRAVEKPQAEIDILNLFTELGIPYRFVKLVADTNAQYLTPDSLKILGEKKVREKFQEFKERLVTATRAYPVQPDVILFTELLASRQNEYDEVFEASKIILEADPSQLVPPGVFELQMQRSFEHMGMEDSPAVREFAIRTIATYAAEGVLFEQLSRTEEFSNMVWLNNHEIDQRTIDITNCYRQKSGLEPLPMVFIDELIVESN